MNERLLSSLQLREIQSQVLERLEALSGRVLVIGDIGLDEYLLGEVLSNFTGGSGSSTRCQGSGTTHGFGC